MSLLKFPHQCAHLKKSVDNLNHDCSTSFLSPNDNFEEGPAGKIIFGGKCGNSGVIFISLSTPSLVLSPPGRHGLPGPSRAGEPAREERELFHWQW